MMVTVPGDILETIDNALADCTSPDAMRWCPERSETDLAPQQPDLSGYYIEFDPPAAVSSAGIREAGEILPQPPAPDHVAEMVVIGGQQYRIIRYECPASGIYGFEAIPVPGP